MIVRSMQPVETSDPRPYRFSKEQYHQMADLGWFHGVKAELIDGEIMVQSPQNPLHSCITDQVQDVLRQVFGTGFWVRMQLPLDLGAPIEPEPDVSVVRGSRLDYLRRHPTDPVLLVEVSESTLAYDRGEKASLYASAGVADYWIVNLVDQCLEVCRQPVQDGSQPHGWRYVAVRKLGSNDAVQPLHLGVPIAVRDLLP